MSPQGLPLWPSVELVPSRCLCPLFTHKDILGHPPSTEQNSQQTDVCLLLRRTLFTSSLHATCAPKALYGFNRETGMGSHTCNPPALGRLRLGHQEFEASLGYKVRPCLKTEMQNKTKTKTTTLNWAHKLQCLRGTLGSSYVHFPNSVGYL